jgi:hypothetical protein
MTSDVSDGILRPESEADGEPSIIDALAQVSDELRTIWCALHSPHAEERLRSICEALNGVVDRLDVATKKLISEAPPCHLGC